jgi:hypothetical protein
LEPEKLSAQWVQNLHSLQGLSWKIGGQLIQNDTLGLPKLFRLMVMAWSHTAQQIKHFLRDLGVKAVEHFPCSPQPLTLRFLFVSQIELQNACYSMMGMKI